MTKVDLKQLQISELEGKLNQALDVIDALVEDVAYLNKKVNVLNEHALKIKTSSIYGSLSETPEEFASKLSETIKTQQGGKDISKTIELEKGELIINPEGIKLHGDFDWSKNTDTGVIVGGTLQASKIKTPNELRKDIIEEAKQLVKSYLEFSPFKFEFDVDFNNRTVKVTKRNVVQLGSLELRGTILDTAIAKCNPVDIFNVHLGKAIALGKLEEMYIEDFMNAPQPHKAVEGMIVESTQDYIFATPKVVKGQRFTLVEVNDKYNNKLAELNSSVANTGKVVDDSNAKY